MIHQLGTFTEDRVTTEYAVAHYKEWLTGERAVATSQISDDLDRVEAAAAELATMQPKTIVWIVTRRRVTPAWTAHEIESVARPVHRIHITRRVFGFLEGTQAYADAGVTTATSESPADLRLMRKVYEAPVTRKDGRFTVELDDEEAAALEGYVGAMLAGAQDNTWDPSGVADLLAARAVIKQLWDSGVPIKETY